jgi:hypothetical protein
MNIATVSFLMSMILMMSWRSIDADIQCYSEFNPDGVSIVNCSTNSCHKMAADGSQLVKRGCGMGMGNGCTGSTEAGVSFKMCECSTALCNTAAAVVTVTSLVGLTAAAALAAAAAILRAL